MRTAAILPVKRFGQAKQRLSQSVAPATRRELAQAMATDVLEELAGTDGLDLLIVVTGEPALAEAAGAVGATLVADAEDQGQSAATTLGIDRARAEGAVRVLLVAGDCPALDRRDVESLLSRTPDSAPYVVVVPDRHGTGTNALLLAPPDAIAPSFGPDSFGRHLARARSAGVSTRIERPPSLLLDVDTGEDMHALRTHLQAGGPPARRTRALLGIGVTGGPADLNADLASAS